MIARIKFCFTCRNVFILETFIIIIVENMIQTATIA